MRDTGINIENDFIEVTNATKATRLKYFHFKIVNRIISTNVFLERIGAIDDDSCSFCHGELETLVHLFWQCPNVQDFLRKINQELFASSNSRNVQRHYFTLNIKSWFFLTRHRLRGGGRIRPPPPPRFFWNNFFIYYCIDMKLGTPLRASIWRRVVQIKSKSAGNFLL